MGHFAPSRREVDRYETGSPGTGSSSPCEVDLESGRRGGTVIGRRGAGKSDSRSRAQSLGGVFFFFLIFYIFSANLVQHSRTAALLVRLRFLPAGGLLYYFPPLSPRSPSAFFLASLPYSSSLLPFSLAPSSFPASSFPMAMCTRRCALPLARKFILHERTCSHTARLSTLQFEGATRRAAQ